MGNDADRYAKHTNKSSNEVYELFKQENVHDLLENDYDDLHGMSMEYIIRFIDEYLGVA